MSDSINEFRAELGALIDKWHPIIAAEADYLDDEVPLTGELDSHYVTGWVLVVSTGPIEDADETLAYTWSPSTQLAHTTIGLLADALANRT